MARSHLVLRALFAATSLGLLVVTLLVAIEPLWLGALVVVALTAYVVPRPGSHLVAVLLTVHLLHWLITVAAPTTTRAWVLTLVGAWLGLLLHTTAALAAALPPAAPVPAATLARWGRRTALVAAGAVPVWLVAFLVGRSGTNGDIALTYAAVAGAGLLALASWLTARERS